MRGASEVRKFGSQLLTLETSKAPSDEIGLNLRQHVRTAFFFYGVSLCSLKWMPSWSDEARTIIVGYKAEVAKFLKYAYCILGQDKLTIFQFASDRL